MKSRNRVDVVKQHVSELNVLDVGSEDIDGNHSMHDELLTVAKCLHSIDIQFGQNFETFKLNKIFDCIFAGEIIEHLDNVGLFLDNCREHLIESGTIIITTPNPYGFYRVIRHAVFGKYDADDVFDLREHTALFTFELLRRLLNRHGFSVEKELYINHEKYGSFPIPRFRNTLFSLSRKI